MTDHSDNVSTMPPSRPPPLMSSGPIAWMRANLFSGVFSTIATLVLAYLLISLVWTIFEWMVIDGVWQSGPADNLTEACRESQGYCFPFLEDKWRFILFGLYPGDERWRPALALIIVVGMAIISGMPRFWSRRLMLLWYVGGVASGILMFGGEISLAVIFWIFMFGAPIIRRLMPTASPGRASIVGGISNFTLAWLVLAFVQLLLSTLGLSPLSNMAIDTGMEFVPNRLWGGLPLTVGMSLIGCGVAFPIGILLALGRRSEMPAIRVICVIYIEIIRGVPLITVLFMAAFLFPLFMPEGVNIDNLLRAQVGLIMFASAYLAEVIRGGLQAVPRGQFEAAQSMGLTYWQMIRLIIMPQALKISIPPLVNTFIGFFKDTSLLIIIGVFDLMYAAKASITDPTTIGFYPEAYSFVAIIYFGFCFSMSKYSQWLEKVTDTGLRR